MVLADDRDLVGRAIIGKLAAGLGDLVHVGRAVMVARVDANGMTPQHCRGVDPFLVVFDCLVASFLLGVAQVSLIVDHDEHARDPLVDGPFLQVFQVLGVLGFVLEKLVHEFDGFDPVSFAGDLGEVEVVDLVAEQLFVERPLGQRDLEVTDLAGFRFARRLPSRHVARSPGAQESRACEAAFQKLPAIHSGVIHWSLLPGLQAREV